MSKWVRAFLVVVVAGLVIFGIGALLVSVFGNASSIYSICALGFASFTLNFLIPRRRRRKSAEYLGDNLAVKVPPQASPPDTN